MNKEVRALLGTDINALEDDEGRVKAIFDSIESETFDRYAIGGTTPSAFLASSGIKEEDGKPVFDENYETNKYLFKRNPNFQR